MGKNYSWMSKEAIIEEIEGEIWKVRDLTDEMDHMSLEELNEKVYSDFIKPIEKINYISKCIKYKKSKDLIAMLDKFVNTKFLPSYENKGVNLREYLIEYLDDVSPDFQLLIEAVPKLVCLKSLKYNTGIFVIVVMIAFIVILYCGDGTPIPFSQLFE